MNRSAHKTDDDRGRNADASERWWPSPFGEDDQHGMLNHITDAKRREAPALVREGRFYDLGHILEKHAPVFPGRYFRQTLVTTAHQINADPGEQPPTGLGDNKVNWITVVVAGTMQEGTHIDGLNHLQIGDRCYNGWSVAALAGSAGTKRLGAETIPQIVTRGWLVDVTAVRGVDQLRGGDVITTEDVHRATRAPPWCGRRGQRVCTAGKRRVMAKQIRVRRVYEEPTPDDGARVLVDRIWPRGLRKDAAHLDEWAKDVSPSTELRVWYQHDPAKFAEFRRRYEAELKAPQAQAELKQLRARAARGHHWPERGI